MCVTTMAQQDFPNGKFRFLPRWSLWSGGLARGHGVGLYAFGGAFGLGSGGSGGGGYPHFLWFTAILLLPPWGGGFLAFVGVIIVGVIIKTVPCLSHVNGKQEGGGNTDYHSCFSDPVDLVHSIRVAFT